MNELTPASNPERVQPPDRLQQQRPDQAGKAQDSGGSAAGPPAAPDRGPGAPHGSDKAPLPGQHASAADAKAQAASPHGGEGRAGDTHATANARVLGYLAADRQYASQPARNSPARERAQPAAPHAEATPAPRTTAGETVRDGDDGQRDVLPVAKFSPAPGIFVDRTATSIHISGTMELHGDEASPERAKAVQDSINSAWTHAFPDGQNVSCNVSVNYRGSGSEAGQVTQIEAAKISAPSKWKSDSMILNANEKDAFTWVAAHEFGHVIGLDDRYDETRWSHISGEFGGDRSTTPKLGYEHNIMAVGGGALESQNVKDVARENEPSRYWIHDDDQVRDWVSGHSLADIGALPTASKLQAIDTLMSGWISDDDIAAITKICKSVSTRTEAEAIIHGVDVQQMTSIGQRTTVRVAFAEMKAATDSAPALHAPAGHVEPDRQSPERPQQPTRTETAPDRPHSPHVPGSPDGGTAALSPRTEAYLRGDRQYTAPAVVDHQPSDASRTAPAPARADARSAASHGGDRPETTSTAVIRAAQESQEKWGIPASVTIAQYNIESGRGAHMPKDSNNPFGIKAAGNQPFVEARTHETVGGKDVEVTAKFRKFGSIGEAFDEHARLLATARPYANARNFASDPDAFARALTGVYATAPRYGDILIREMKAHNLYQYDLKPGQQDAAKTPPGGRDSRTEPVPREQPRQFGDSRAAVRFLNGGGEAGRADSQFDHHLSQPRVLKSPAGGYSASADVRWTFSNERSTTTITRPEWPRMTAADRAAVQRFVEAAEGHEARHHQVARDFMAGAGRTVTAHGSTPQEATQNLQHTLAQYRQDTQRALDARTAEYDVITDHGRKQQVVGGRNVRLIIP
jgi:flagellum-specific peptidoglycan hydrolase FlgJ